MSGCGSAIDPGDGPRIVKPPARTFWVGYAGYFQDRHLWEVVFDPDWE